MYSLPLKDGIKAMEPIEFPFSARFPNRTTADGTIGTFKVAIKREGKLLIEKTLDLVAYNKTRWRISAWRINPEIITSGANVLHTLVTQTEYFDMATKKWIYSDYRGACHYNLTAQFKIPDNATFVPQTSDKVE